MHNINYQNIRFLSSIPNFYSLPSDNIIEIAFVGRSNSGKSSTINTLTSQKKLAKTSKKPGSTKLINLFEIPSKIRLIDFPGYGYSKTSKIIKIQWNNIFQQYIKKRKNLIGIVLTIDIQHSIKQTDTNLIKQINHINIPLLILLNKSDKLPTNISYTTLHKTQQLLFFQNIQIITFSTKTLEGLYNLKQIINQWFHKSQKNCDYK